MIVKIESADSIPNLHSIISASDGVSVNIMIKYCVYYICLLQKVTREENFINHVVLISTMHWL